MLSAAKTRTESKDDSPSADAPYPNDFTKIMQMVQSGQTPPGIRTDINDKPVDPHSKLERGNREARLKVCLIHWIQFVNLS